MASVDLSEKLEKRLAALIATTHKPRSYYIERALEEFLEEQEDYLIAVERHEEFLKSGQKAIPLEEVKRKYGLEDA